MPTLRGKKRPPSASDRAQSECAHSSASTASDEGAQDGSDSEAAPQEPPSTVGERIACSRAAKRQRTVSQKQHELDQYISAQHAEKAAAKARRLAEKALAAAAAAKRKEACLLYTSPSPRDS